MQQIDKMFSIVAVIMTFALLINLLLQMLENRARVHRSDFAARFAAEK